MTEKEFDEYMDAHMEGANKVLCVCGFIIMFTLPILYPLIENHHLGVTIGLSPIAIGITYWIYKLVCSLIGLYRKVLDLTYERMVKEAESERYDS